MYRRRVIFIDVSGTTYISPEFNGDKAEMEYFRLSDTCDVNWMEIQDMFHQCKTIKEFKDACIMAQGFYHSCLPNPEPPEPAVPISELEAPPKFDVIIVITPKDTYYIHQMEVKGDDA